MSKYVKDLLTEDLKQRWQGVNDLLLVSVMGINANANSQLRRHLREKNIHLIVVKNSMARRASEGTPVAPAFEQMEGSLAAVWGTEDVVSLAKEVMRLAEDKQFAPFEPRGGVMDGAALTAEQVKAVSRWPSRQEQLSLLVGQILSPGAILAGQLTAVGGALASQIQQLAESDGDAAPEAAAEAPAEAPPAE